MDCARFDTVVMDELYGELDEVTSQAAKRHAEGCSRCAGELERLHAVREKTALLRLESPSGLEFRIVSRLRDLERAKAKEPSSGWLRALSIAGRWAMRPQTAMAALFLLLIGSSAVLLRTKGHGDAGTMTVSATQSKESVSLREEAPSGFSDEVLRPRAPQAAVPPAPATAAPSGGDGLLLGLNKDVPEPMAARGAAAGGAKADDLGALAQAAEEGARHEAKPGEAPRDDNLDTKSAEAKKAKSGSLEDGIGQYRANRYDEALETFRALASQQTPAALWAGRAARSTSGGCNKAIPFYEDVMRRAPGTQLGWDAMLEGGDCYRIVGRHDTARRVLGTLLTVPAYAERAKAVLAKLPSESAQARAAPKAEAAPTTSPPNAVTAPASPNKSAVDTSDPFRK